MQHVGVTLAASETAPLDGIGATSSTSAVPGRSGARILRVGAAARVPRPAMDIKSPIDFGFIEDWDAMERIWEYGLAGMHADASTHPVIVAETPFNVTSQRERMTELIFESFGAPAMYLARSPVLIAFSMGRSSAIVVDIGASCTRVTPVHEGYVLNKGMHLSEIGGTLLTEALLTSLVRGGLLAGGEVPIRPAYHKISRKGKPAPAAAAASEASGSGGGASNEVDMAASGGAAAATAPSTFVRSVGGCDVHRVTGLPAITGTYRSSQELDVIDDMKKSICFVHETGFDESMAAKADEAAYELPDGQVLRTAALRQSVPELLFRTEATDAFRHLVAARSTSAWLCHYNAQVVMRMQADGGSGAASASPIPLQRAIHGALLSSAPEIRRDLCNNVLLAGGGSNMRDIHQRLHWELLALIPAAFKPRVVAPAPVEREFAAWIGGSVLASLGTFQQMWFSRLEYEEEGAAAVERKCS